MEHAEQRTPAQGNAEGVMASQRTIQNETDALNVRPVSHQSEKLPKLLQVHVLSRCALRWGEEVVISINQTLPLVGAAGTLCQSSHRPQRSKCLVHTCTPPYFLQQQTNHS